MVSLSSVARRFEIPFTVVEGGSGTFQAIVSEADQNSAPAYVFNAPRLVMRVMAGVLPQGTVILSPSGIHYVSGYNGPSEGLWESFRLFRATGQYEWKRRTKVLDRITGLSQEGLQETIGLVWAAIEPISRETLDRKVHSSFEFNNYVAAANILSDDILDGRQVNVA